MFCAGFWRFFREEFVFFDTVGVGRYMVEVDTDNICNVRRFDVSPRSNDMRQSVQIQLRMTIYTIKRLLMTLKKMVR